MKTIKFNNVDYPVRQISFTFGDYLVSTETLNDKLLNHGMDYISKEAQFVDECIFYFIDEKFIFYSENFIRKMIISEI